MATLFAYLSFKIIQGAVRKPNSTAKQYKLANLHHDKTLRKHTIFSTKMI